MIRLFARAAPLAVALASFVTAPAVAAPLGTPAEVARTEPKPHPGRSPAAVVDAAFAAINRHDAAGLAALYAPDAVIVNSDACAPQTGPDAVRRGHQALIAALPDLSVEITDRVTQGDQVALIFVAHSKGLGPTGELLFSDFMTVRHGLITRDVTLFNPGKPCA